MAAKNVAMLMGEDTDLDLCDEIVHRLEQERTLTETFPSSLSITADSEKRFANLEVAALCEAALEDANVGGDFYDAFALNAGKVALVVGDVCGKGVQAALHTDQIKHTVCAFLRESPNAKQCLTRLNRFICDAQRLDNLVEETFTVMALAVVDPASGDTAVATAGAEPPLLLRACGETETIKTTGSLPLGVDSGEAYREISLRLNPGDALLLVTDGITEARHGADFLGYDGLEALVRKARNQTGNENSLRQYAERILKETKRFAEGPLHDDACLLLARRRIGF